MVMVHTNYGPGEIVAEDVVRGRKSYRVAGTGFDVWLDETKVRLPRYKTPHYAAYSAPDEIDLNAPHWQGRDLDNPDEHIPDHLFEPGGPFHPDTQDEIEDAYNDYQDSAFRHYRRRPHDISRENPEEFGAFHRDLFGSTQHQGWAPVDFDNSTCLPYNPSVQHPSIPGELESTIQPIHDLDSDERLQSVDSITFEHREPAGPGKVQHLFAGTERERYRDKAYSQSRDRGREEHERQDLEDDDDYRTSSIHEANPLALAPLLLRALPTVLRGVGVAKGLQGLVPGGGGDETGQGSLFSDEELGVPGEPGNTGPGALGQAVNPGMLDKANQVIDALKPGQGWQLPAGLSHRYIDVEAAHHDADYHNNPVAQFRHDPDAYINRIGHVLDETDTPTDIHLGQRQYMDMVEADPQIREAAWKDVREKGLRLRGEGKVAVHDVGPNRIMATVEGDHGVYDVMISREGMYGGLKEGYGLRNWRCACLWGQWAWKRKYSYVGRLCSHGYAAFLEMQSQGVKKRGYPKRADVGVPPGGEAPAQPIGTNPTTSNPLANKPIAGTTPPATETPTSDKGEVTASRTAGPKTPSPYPFEGGGGGGGGRGAPGGGGALAPPAGGGSLPQTTPQTSLPGGNLPSGKGMSGGQTQVTPAAPPGQPPVFTDMAGKPLTDPTQVGQVNLQQLHQNLADMGFQKPGHRHVADALQMVPTRLSPELIVNDTPDDTQQFVDVTKDERTTTGPKGIVHFANLMAHCEATGTPYPRELVAFLYHYADHNGAPHSEMESDEEIEAGQTPPGAAKPPKVPEPTGGAAETDGTATATNVATGKKPGEAEEEEEKDPNAQQQQPAADMTNPATAPTGGQPMGGMDMFGDALASGAGALGEIGTAMAPAAAEIATQAAPMIGDAISSGLGSIMSIFGSRETDGYGGYVNREAAVPADTSGEEHLPFEGSGAYEEPINYNSSKDNVGDQTYQDVTDLGTYNIHEMPAKYRPTGMAGGGIQRAGQGPKRPPVVPEVVRVYSPTGPIKQGQQGIPDIPDPYSKTASSFGGDGPMPSGHQADFSPEPHARDIVAQFQNSAAAQEIMAEKGGGQSNDDIAGAANAFLQRTAGRNFSMAEQHELMNERHPLGARNLDRLDLTGTHYEAENSIGLFT